MERQDLEIQEGGTSITKTLMASKYFGIDDQQNNYPDSTVMSDHSATAKPTSFYNSDKNRHK